MKKKYLIVWLLVLFLTLLFSGCTSSTQPSNKNVELTVSIAASLTDFMNEAKTQFENQHPNITIHFNIGGSGSLAQQIEQGAPVDLFISAAPDKMSRLEEKGLLLKNSRRNLLSNQLVLITQPNLKLKANQAFEGYKVLNSSEIQHIAIGEPSIVPAGKYAKEVLEHQQLWQSLQQNKIVPTKDVRQVLTYVETGNAEAGFVYLSDALNNPKVKIIKKVDPLLHEPIVYPVAIIAESKHINESEQFFDFLTSTKGQDLIKKYGFIPK